jgi:uncharacterized protein (TIGR02147 family)
MRMVRYDNKKLIPGRNKMLIANNYAQILRDEFDKRVQKNSRYSMRAFAKHLGISPASLSNILAEKKGLSDRLARSIAKVLDFNSEETDFFCALVNSVDARSKEVREKNKKVVTQYLRKKKRIIIGNESADFVSEIRNFVLLELLKTSKVKAPLQKTLLTLKPLVVSLKEQQKVINQMIDLGMVEIEDGYYFVKHENFLVPDRVAIESQKKVHLKALEHAKYAYENEDYNEREFYIIITPLNRAQMDEIKVKIREFADELMYKYGTPSKADSIYGLCTYLFPLEKNVTRES